MAVRPASYNRYTILYKFSIDNNSSYISIYFNFKENPTSRGRDPIKKVALLLNIYLGSSSEYYYIPSELLQFINYPKNALSHVFKRDKER